MPEVSWCHFRHFSGTVDHRSTGMVSPESYIINTPLQTIFILVMAQAVSKRTQSNDRYYCYFLYLYNPDPNPYHNQSL